MDSSWPRLRFDIRRTLTRIDRIQADVCDAGNVLGRILDPDVVANFAAIARRSLRLTMKADAPLRGLLEDHADELVDSALARRLAVRLAGNHHVLTTGDEDRSVLKQGNYIWEPLRIEELHHGEVCHRSADGRPRVLTRMQVERMSGERAGDSICLEVPHAKLVRFYARIIGWGKREFVPDYRELSGMWFYALLGHTDDAWRLRAVRAPLNYRRYNRTIRSRRADPCGHDRDLPCHDCSFGLDRCDRAVHPVTWASRPCGKCNRRWAPFDPRIPNAVVCLDCRDKSASRLARIERLAG